MHMFVSVYVCVYRDPARRSTTGGMCVCVYLSVYMYVCMYVAVYVCVCMCLYVYLCVCSLMN